MKNYWMIRFKKISFYGMLALFFNILDFLYEKRETCKIPYCFRFTCSGCSDGKERMQAIVDAANQEKVDFIIQLGGFYSFG